MPWLTQVADDFGGDADAAPGGDVQVAGDELVDDKVGVLYLKAPVANVSPKIDLRIGRAKPETLDLSQ